MGLDTIAVLVTIGVGVCGMLGTGYGVARHLTSRYMEHKIMPVVAAMQDTVREVREEVGRATKLAQTAYRHSEITEEQLHNLQVKIAGQMPTKDDVHGLRREMVEAHDKMGRRLDDLYAILVGDRNAGRTRP